MSEEPSDRRRDARRVDDAGRRNLLKAVAGMSLFGTGAARRGSADGAALRTTDGLAALSGTSSDAFERFYTAETVTYLPDIDSGGAVGLTTDGWYHWPADGDEWEFAVEYMGNDRDPLEGVIAKRLNQRKYPSNQTDEGSGSASDPFRVSSVLDAGGRFVFDAGYYETPGLEPDDDVDHERTAVYLEGDGIRTTTVSSDGTDEPVYSLDIDGTGNFGGLSDMTVYGSGAGEGPTEPLVRISGVIDQLIENVILRYSGGDLLRLEDSASGLRLRNSWIENTTGYGVWTTHGTRAKLSDLHILSCTEGGINTDLSNSQFSNLSVQNCPTAIEMREGKNQLANAYLNRSEDEALAANGQFSCITNVLGRENGRTLDINSPYSSVSNVISMYTAREAVVVRSDFSTFDNILVYMFGGDSSDGYGVTVRGDGNTVADVTAVQRDEGERYRSTNLLRIDGDENVVEGLLAVDADKDWRVTVAPGSTENVLRGVKNVSLAEFDDRGVRTLFNGRGRNDGDPAEGGEWHGHADYAAAQNALVEDTANGAFYRATTGGSWVPA